MFTAILLGVQILLLSFMVFFQVMQEYGVYNMIFSSSATVYGDPKKLPIDENHPTGGCTNPYGKTKYFIEEILKDLCAADKVRMKFCPKILRLQVWRWSVQNEKNRS